MYDSSYPITYPNFGSEDDDDEVSRTGVIHTRVRNTRLFFGVFQLSEMDGNESKSPTDVPSETAPNPEPVNGKRRFSRMKEPLHDSLVIRWYVYTSGQPHLDRQSDICKNRACLCVSQSKLRFIR